MLLSPKISYYCYRYKIIITFHTHAVVTNIHHKLCSSAPFPPAYAHLSECWLDMMRKVSMFYDGLDIVQRHTMPATKKDRINVQLVRHRWDRNFSVGMVRWAACCDLGGMGGVFLTSVRGGRGCCTCRSPSEPHRPPESPPSSSGGPTAWRSVNQNYRVMIPIKLQTNIQLKAQFIIKLRTSMAVCKP